MSSRGLGEDLLDIESLAPRAFELEFLHNTWRRPKLDVASEREYFYCASLARQHYT